MVDLVVSGARLVGAFLLVGLNGFFVASEFAYVRVRSSAVEHLVAEERTGATILQEAVDNLDDYLATTQLGITIASLGLGWLGEPAIAALLEPVLAPLLPENLLHLVAFAVGFTFITFLHVVFGELAPKTVAIAEAERVALLVSPLMKFFYYVLFPGIVVFNGAANRFTRLLGVPPASETDETLSERELRTVLARSGQTGEIDTTEVEMIEQIFELDDTEVRAVMVPRPDAVTVDSDRSIADLRSLILESGHTRYPVVDADDPDQVVGFVDAKDVLGVLEREGEDALESATAGDIARDLPIVPETTPAVDLLEQFQRDRAQIAAVIDEWGVFEGLVTVEDLVEEIVGDLRDGFDVDEPSIDRRGDGTYVVDGGVTVSTVNERLGADFQTEAFGTIGGLVLDRLGRAPEVGDRTEVDGYALEVTAVEGSRVDSLVVREASPGEESAEEGTGTG
ncbi:hemolysin family protein [Halopiger thermotolerans]